jgi:hypothetical protein
MEPVDYLLLQFQIPWYFYQSIESSIPPVSISIVESHRSIMFLFEFLRLISDLLFQYYIQLNILIDNQLPVSLL